MVGEQRHGARAAHALARALGQAARAEAQEPRVGVVVAAREPVRRAAHAERVHRHAVAAPHRVPQARAQPEVLLGLDAAVRDLRVHGVVHQVGQPAERVAAIQPVQARAIGHLGAQLGADLGHEPPSIVVAAVRPPIGQRAEEFAVAPRAAAVPGHLGHRAARALAGSVAHGRLQPVGAGRHDQVLERRAQRDHQAAAVGVARGQRALSVGEQPDRLRVHLEAPGLGVPVAGREHRGADQGTGEVEPAGGRLRGKRPGLQGHRAVARAARPGVHGTQRRVRGRPPHDDEELAPTQDPRSVRLQRSEHRRRSQGWFHGPQRVRSPRTTRQPGRTKRVEDGGLARLRQPRGTATVAACPRPASSRTPRSSRWPAVCASSATTWSRSPARGSRRSSRRRDAWIAPSSR